jgi:hypothetical protein
VSPFAYGSPLVQALDRLSNGAANRRASGRAFPVTRPAAGTTADDGRATAPLRCLALELVAAAIFSSYYQSDAIDPIADLLGRQHLRWCRRSGGRAARTVMAWSLRVRQTGAPAPAVRAG